MKGIILSGGTGSRLFPLTLSISKQIIPVYDKPMIYYPLSVLMLAGIKDILIITSREHIDIFKKQLGNGAYFGIKITYEIQESPNGIPEAFLISEKFIGSQKVALILGDNIFYGQKLGKLLKNSFNQKKGSKIFLHEVKNPNDYGVIKFNKNFKIKMIVEKPKKFVSNFAITGLYLFDNNVISLSKKLRPSKRGELEIVDLLNLYLIKNQLDYEIFGRGFTWLDAGTHDTLLSASQFIRTIEERQGNKIGCIEEIAYTNKWINKIQLKNNILKLKNSSYGKYLNNILEKMKIIKTKIQGLILINCTKYLDKRGSFLKHTTRNYILKTGIKKNFLQDNFSFSKKCFERTSFSKEKPTRKIDKRNKGINLRCSS